jgi:6-pyruvoyltetrahydropterin/6-carboxytetrahydropterin synthase
MTFKFDWEHPNFNPMNSYREYAKLYHNPLKCYYCGCTEEERKIDIHHLDEDRENWLLSNLVPVCNVCHTFFHYKRYKTPHIKVEKIFRFESAHHLMNYCGPCEHTHGHSYLLIVGLKGPINRDTGMVIDYKELKNIVQKYIIDIFDHSNINDVMDCNPTAENMILFIWEKLEKEGLVKGLYEITLKETDSSIATIHKSDMLRYYKNNKEIICNHTAKDILPRPTDAKKVRCRICEKEFWSLYSHLHHSHNINKDKYTEMFPHDILEDPLITKWKVENVMKKVSNYQYGEE